MKARSVAFGCAAYYLALASVASAQTGDPKPPPGLDPGGPAVALISEGIDYTVPQIAARLARDGEGEPIAMDLIDGDVTPYADPAASGGTAMAVALLNAHPGIRLIAVRASPADPSSLINAMLFVSRTPARVAAIELSGMTPEATQLLKLSAEKASGTSFVWRPPEASEAPANMYAPAPSNAPTAPSAADPAGADVAHIAAVLTCLVERGTPASDLRKELATAMNPSEQSPHPAIPEETRCPPNSKT